MAGKAFLPNLQSAINRAKKAEHGKQTYLQSRYKSIKELGEYLQAHPEELESPRQDGGKFKINGKLIESSSKGHSYLLSDEELMSQSTSNETFWDGTFDCRPKIAGAQQVITIMSKIEEVVCNIYKSIIIYQSFRVE